MVGLPASQHGYSYVHNNPVNLTDPTGNIPPLILIGAGLFYIGDVIYQTYQNTEAGMHWSEAIYYKNHDQAEILRSIKTGLLLPLEVIPGVDGALDGFFTQLIDNLADPCAGLFDNTGEEAIKGAAIDLAFFGVGKTVKMISEAIKPAHFSGFGSQIDDFLEKSPRWSEKFIRRFLEPILQKDGLTGGIVFADYLPPRYIQSDKMITLPPNPPRIVVMEEMFHFYEHKARNWVNLRQGEIALYLEEFEVKGVLHSNFDWTENEIKALYDSLDGYIDVLIEEFVR